MKLTDVSDVKKMIKRGDIYYCSLNSKNDKKLHNNQYLIGKTRACLIIGSDDLYSYPFYYVVPIRNNNESAYVNQENILPIVLEKEYDSVLDFSQVRPVHICFIHDYIGSLRNNEILSEIERKILTNFDINKNIIYIDPNKYENEETFNMVKNNMENILDAVTSNLSEGKNINVKITIGNDDNGKISKRIEEDDTYKKWTKEKMKLFLTHIDSNYISIEELESLGFHFKSKYEFKRCIWYCRSKISYKD